MSEKVTEEMVERAAKSLAVSMNWDWDYLQDKRNLFGMSPAKQELRDSARAALTAALDNQGERK